MYNREKEFLKLAFMKGWLDVGAGMESLKPFVEIMADEMEALLAIEFCTTWLEDVQVRELLQIVKPNDETLRELAAWKSSINGPVKPEAHPHD